MPHMFTAADRISSADLAHAGLLEMGPGCVIDSDAAFVPADALGTLRPVRLGAQCVIAAGAVMHGGVILHDGVRVEEHVVAGKPEHGYAVRRTYPGMGATTEIGAGVVLRSGAIVYAGTSVGGHTTIGHHTLLRNDVTIGADSQLGHHLTVERGSRIGAAVRFSPGSHITANTIIEDRVFLGAGVRTINDKELSRPGWPATAQTLAQFVCGFHDLDLRDATGAGHGALLHHMVSEPTRKRWLTRLAAGDLIGIAATERHGGSRIREITTRAERVGMHRWAITGEKFWVSRLVEASGMVVFFRDPDARICAAIIDATASGQRREPIPPAGLTGWTWGELHLEQVHIDPCTDLIGEPGHGLDLFRQHFAGFRPLVAATALGTAAGVHSLVTATLDAKERAGVLPRIRDNALITLGRTHVALYSALLGTLHAARLCAGTTGDGDLWARLSKAQAVDTAHHAVNELAPLVGVSSYRQASTIAKARNDLTGLLYADGIHDSLYRSGGRTLLANVAGSVTSGEPADRPAVV